MQDRFKFRYFYKPLKIMYEFQEKDYLYEFAEKENYVLMQCTGSKDKNGKLVYEGDILKDRWGNIKPIEFKCGCFFWGLEEGSYWISDKDSEMEIIGNIYENEELLYD